MRIFEVKNNLIKIFYETNDNLFLSGFVMIKDDKESYIGQIMYLESGKHGNVAIAKITFNLTPDGIIKSYTGSIPSINSSVSNIDSVDLLKLIQGQSPIYIGEYIENDSLISLDKSLLENKLVVCSESQENSDLIIKTLNRQIKNYGKKTIIIDTEGENIFDRNNFVLRKNFRLPINSQIINFIYEKGLDFKSARSKAILQETFLDIQYYLSSLEEPYIPVNKFIDILEKQYKKSALPELVLLKNALIQFNNGEIFANNILEYKELVNSLLNNQTTSLDISKVDESIQREAISYIYSVIQELPDEYYVFIKANNENSDKKLLKQIFSTKNALTTITCSYSYKYLVELKKIAKNLILFAPILQQQDFADYNTLLSSLGRFEFIVYGQATQFMPLIAKISDRIKIMSVPPRSVLTTEETQRVVQKQLKKQQEVFEEEKIRKENFIKQQQASCQALQQQMHQMPPYTQTMPNQQIPQVFYNQPFMQPQAYNQNAMNAYVPNPYYQNQAYYQQQCVAPLVMNTGFMQNPAVPVQQQYYQPMQPQVLPNNIAFSQPQVQYPQQINPLMQQAQVPQTYSQQVYSQQQIPQDFVMQQPNINPQEVASNIQAQDYAKEKSENTKIQNEIQKPVLKTIEPQQMPIEQEEQKIEPKQEQAVSEPKVDNTTNYQEETRQTVDNIEESNHLTEKDLDSIQNVDLYENEQQNASFDEIYQNELANNDDSNSYQGEVSPDINNDNEEDDSYLDEITPDEEDMNIQYNDVNEAAQQNEQESLPIYPATTGSNNDTDFEKGDTVVHSQFGNGRIEKIINYGSKKLCSVYFEGVGRRLLDPSLSEIKKVN
ncbi:hypothetical protein IJG72_01625 [bacterium]|nr:hypothetical protein [bacterium]